MVIPIEQRVCRPTHTTIPVHRLAEIKWQVIDRDVDMLPHAAGEYRPPGEYHQHWEHHRVLVDLKATQTTEIQQQLKSTRRLLGQYDLGRQLGSLVTGYHTLLYSLESQLGPDYSSGFAAEILAHEHTHLLQELRLGSITTWQEAVTYLISPESWLSVDNKLQLDFLAQRLVILSEVQAYQQELLVNQQRARQSQIELLPNLWLQGWRWFYMLQRLRHLSYQPQLDTYNFALALWLRPDIDEFMSESPNYMLSPEYQAELASELKTVLYQPERLIESASPRARLAVDAALIQSTQELQAFLIDLF